MSDKKRKVPKLRFPGFTDAWEQRKLGDMGKVSMCKRVFKSETSEIGEVPFYKIGTFGEVADSYISKD
ncbi:MAG: restriction endonuclease subunit S, partial [Abiotrophia defectiva]|nr:restriction endonuclease subunit S [Abiotrophia defectiva]